MSPATRPLSLLCAALSLALVAPTCGSNVAIPGLSASVSVTTDKNGVPHLRAQNDLDLARVQGLIHARDRFLQIDLTRREVSGDLSELRGPAFLAVGVGLARGYPLTRARHRAILDELARRAQREVAAR